MGCGVSKKSANEPISPDRATKAPPLFPPSSSPCLPDPTRAKFPTACLVVGLATDGTPPESPRTHLTQSFVPPSPTLHRNALHRLRPDVQLRYRLPRQPKHAPPILPEIIVTPDRSTPTTSPRRSPSPLPWPRGPRPGLSHLLRPPAAHSYPLSGTEVYVRDVVCHAPAPLTPIRLRMAPAPHRLG